MEKTNTYFARRLDHDERRHRTPEDNQVLQSSYSSSLDEQVRAKAELVNRRKAEELLQDQKYAKEWDLQQELQDKREAERKLAQKEKYFRELKDQTDANLKRKQNEIQSKKEENSRSTDGFHWSQGKTYDEKHQSQLDMKASLDLMIAEKQQFKDAEKKESQMYDNEMQRNYQTIVETEKLEQAKKKAEVMANQKEYLDYLGALKKGSHKRDEDLQDVADMELKTRSDNREADRVALKNAHHKLEDDNQKDWDQQILGHQKDKERKRQQIQQEADEMSSLMNQMDMEENKRQQKTLDNNKQYQQDLLDQMKWKK